MASMHGKRSKERRVNNVDWITSALVLLVKVEEEAIECGVLSSKPKSMQITNEQIFSL